MRVSSAMQGCQVRCKGVNQNERLSSEVGLCQVNLKGVKYSAMVSITV